MDNQWTIAILMWFIALIITKYYKQKDEVSFFICLAVFIITLIFLGLLENSDYCAINGCYWLKE